MYLEFKHPKKYSAFFNLAFFLILSFFAANSLVAAPKSIGKVILATQGVTAQQAATPARNLKRGSPIYLGDTLTTPKGGKAQLRLDDGELLALTEASQVSFDEFNFEANNPKANSSVKHLVTGGLRSITGAVKDTGYQVKTQTGTIGIRGTSFEAFSQNGRNLFVNTHRGDVVVSNNAGSVEIGVNKRQRAAQITAAGQTPRAINPSQLPEQMQQAFNQDPTLAVADDTQNEETAPASYSPVEPSPATSSQENLASSQQTTENLVSFNELTNRQEQATAGEAGLGKLSGFYVSLMGDLSFASYFSNINAINNNGLFNFNSNSGEFILDTNVDPYYKDVFDGKSLNLTKGLKLNDLPENFNYNDYHGNDEQYLLNFWASLVIGDATVVMGLYYQGGMQEPNIESNYLFSNKVLGLAELPRNLTATYNMIMNMEVSNTYNLDISIDTGKLVVDFNKRELGISLSGYMGYASPNNSFTLSNTGTNSSRRIEDFYSSSGINLESSGATGIVEGKITGRFVGSKAEGAIAAYSIGDGQVTGTAVFKR